MSKRKIWAGVVTARDKRLLQLLFENKIATILQIKEAVFPNVSRQMAYRRISQLAKSGYIEKLGYSDGDVLRYACGLTEEGYRGYVRIEGTNDRREQFKSDKLNHDVALVDIRLRLEKIQSVKKVFTENVIQSYIDVADSDEFRDFVELRSDAVIELLIQDKHRFLVPLEFEASFKSKERCRKKLLDYYIKYDGSEVLFICQNAAIQKRMIDIDKDISREFKSKIYFAVLDDVLKPSEKATFINSITDKRIVL